MEMGSVLNCVQGKEIRDWDKGQDQGSSNDLSLLSGGEGRGVRGQSLGW